MKKLLISLLGLGIVTTSAAFAAPLNAENSSPKKMGWMQGFPPEADKVLDAKDGSFFTFPKLRYSVNHMDEFSPTRRVKTSADYKYRIRTAYDSKIENITYTPWGENDEISFKEGLRRNYTDGIIIMHRGRIVYENYPSYSGLEKDGLHAAMSVSKSFTGLLASILVAEGKLDENALVTDYIKELKGSGYEGATVRNVMDMTTAIHYSEDYNDPNAEVWLYSLSGNAMRPDSYTGPKGYYEYLPSLKKIDGQEHGEKFGYKTVNTEVLGWIISRATGKGVAELVSEKLWKPMGAHYDGFYIVDPLGTAFAGGGFSLNLRDAAYFGEMLRNNGRLNGKQIISEKAVEDIARGGGSAENKAQFEKSGEYPLLNGWGYRDMWWCLNNENGAYMARGVHGQAIYIDPKAEMVIARFASNPLASNKYIDPISIPMYEAVAEYLMDK